MVRQLLDAWMNGASDDDANGVEHCALGTINDWVWHICQCLRVQPTGKFSSKRSVGHGILNLEDGIPMILHNCVQVQISRDFDATQKLNAPLHETNG
jgi:hypothetical protein